MTNEASTPEDNKTDTLMEKISLGMWVRIRRGAPIRSMHPKHKQYETKRATIVQVMGIDKGYNPSENFKACDMDKYIRKPSITYVGPNCYWCEVHPDDIEAIVPKPEKRAGYRTTPNYEAA